jgi:hypothetical protein
MSPLPRIIKQEEVRGSPLAIAYLKSYRVDSYRFKGPTSVHSCTTNSITLF